MHGRLSFIAAASLALAALLGPPGRAAGDQAQKTEPAEQKPAGPALKTRLFSITMRHGYTVMPKEILSMEFWSPLPIDNEFQKTYNLVIEGPYTADLYEASETGNRIMHMKGGPRGGVPMRVKISVDVERTEMSPLARGAAAAPGDGAADPKEKEIMERWLRPEARAPMGREIRSRAAKIVSGKKTPLDKARAIYNFMTTKMTLIADVKELHGAGFGNVELTLKELKGNQTDLAAAFVGLCRAADIPARTVIGLKIPPGSMGGTLTDYHSWAEFYLQGTGWVPADPSDGLRDPVKRSYYFGSLDENRLTLSIGRDIVLIPPQAGAPLNYFVNPYWEGDTKDMPTPYVEVQFAQKKEFESKARVVSSTFQKSPVEQPAAPPAPPASEKKPR